MNTTDVLVLNCLKKQFILKNNEHKKIGNGDTSSIILNLSLDLHVYSIL